MEFGLHDLEGGISLECAPKYDIRPSYFRLSSLSQASFAIKCLASIYNPLTLIAFGVHNITPESWCLVSSTQSHGWVLWGQGM